MTKKVSKEMWKFIALVSIWVLCIIFIKLYDQNKYLKAINGIKQHCGYAIGTITSTPPEGSLQRTGGGERILYEYKNHSYDGVQVGLIKRTKIGNKYIIVFDTTKLSRCFVLYDYPVSDSAQFLKDVEYLNQNPSIPLYDSLVWKCLRGKEKLW